MADLTSGRYPQSQALQALTGLVGNTAQPNLPVRSNLEWPIYSGALVDTAGASVAASGVAWAVPVPVDIGMPISKVSFIVGASGASTPTHNFAALYSGTTVTAPPLIAQTIDGTTSAVAASTRFDLNFTTGTSAPGVQVITNAMAPNGFIYVAVSFTVTTSLASVVTIPCGAAAADAGRWFTNSPLYFSQTAGSALGGTAAATLVNASQLTVAPVTFVW